MAGDELEKVKIARQKAESRHVYEVFTPSQPISGIEYFRGRQPQIASCYDAIRDRGRHVLIYGDRGVGKTSLAKVACEEADHGREFSHFQYRCDTGTTFHSMWASLLNDMGFDGMLRRKSVSKLEGGRAGAGIGPFQAGVSTEGGTQRDFEVLEPSQLTPASVVKLLPDLLTKRPGLIIIDELDRLSADVDRVLIADLMKHLSDESTRTTLVLVGVAGTATDLTAGHPSSQRSVSQVKLDRMADEEIREIIEQGGVTCGIAFQENAIERIVDLSNGYPHFAHLLGQKAAFHAVKDHGLLVDHHVLRRAFRDAVTEAEESLRHAYARATASAQTENYMQILHDISYIPETRFTKDDCRDYIRKNRGVVDEILLTNAISRFVADDDSAVLTRVGKGMYRFTDPRMPSYVRMVDQAE